MKTPEEQAAEKAKQEAEAKAKAEAEAAEKAQAENKAKANETETKSGETDDKAKAETEAAKAQKEKEEAEAKALRDELAQLRKEKEERERKEAEAKMTAEEKAQESAKREALANHKLAVLEARQENGYTDKIFDFVHTEGLGDDKVKIADKYKAFKDALEAHYEANHKPKKSPGGGTGDAAETKAKPTPGAKPNLAAKFGFLGDNVS